MNRILVIRGGAIGDFVLTLPAVRLLRDRFPDAHLEILGYPHIAALAEKRFYADAVRSIESGSLAPFFARGSKLPLEIVDYFRSFDLILSYLYDPDEIFETHVRSCGIGRYIAGPFTIGKGEHAALQLARPLSTLGLSVGIPAAHLFPSAADREAVTPWFNQTGRTIALHPGSGSEKKNWPVESWIGLGGILLGKGHDLLVVAGEADSARVQILKAAWKGEPVRFAENLRLPHLAALLELNPFLGHDSGISHIAAAVGAPSVVLYGPTDPGVWGPTNERVRLLRAPDNNLARLEVDSVHTALDLAMSETGAR